MIKSPTLGKISSVDKKFKRLTTAEEKSMKRAKKAIIERLNAK